MNAGRKVESAQNAQRPALSSALILFAVFGGPLAWFLQLNACFALASNPCFIDDERIVARLANQATSPFIIIIAVAAGAVALAALLTSRRACRLTERARLSEHRAPLQTAAGRNRFLALWGMCFSFGSVLLIALTAVAFFVLPRCAG